MRSMRERTGTGGPGTGSRDRGSREKGNRDRGSRDRGSREKGDRDRNRGRHGHVPRGGNGSRLHRANSSLKASPFLEFSIITPFHFIINLLHFQ